MNKLYPQPNILLHVIMKNVQGKIYKTTKFKTQITFLKNKNLQKKADE